MPYVWDHEEHKLLLGPHEAIVIDRNDDSSVSDLPHCGRIKVKIPYLSTDDEHYWWAEYCGPSHQFFSVPAVGTVVYVMFESGHPEKPIWIGAKNLTTAVKDPPTRFRRDHPDVSGYESLNGGAKGHVWEFNDIAGERRIYLEDINNNYQEFDTEANDWNIFFAHDENREIQHDVDDTIGHDEIRDISNDRTQDVGNDESLTVGNDQTQDIGNDQTETIGNDRDITVSNDDSLTVEGNKTIDVTGTWDNTVEGAFTLEGQSTADITFEDKITVTTQDDMQFTVEGDWKSDVTGDTKLTVTGDWKADITGDIELKTAQKFTAKNTIFEFNLDTASSEWKGGAASIKLTAAGIVISVGGASWMMTAAGVIVVAGQYKIAGIDHITHRHVTFGTPPFTSVPTS